jgi:hypothetical protein
MYSFIVLTVELSQGALGSALICPTHIEQTVINEFTALELVVTK